MRTHNAIKNIIVSFLTSIVTILMGIISQKIFVNTLGLEYLGVNGLFMNIISMLGIVELGLGTAIIYHLYQPIADKNFPRIKSLLKYYKKGYRLIAFIVGLIGIAILPFLNAIVGKVTISDNIQVIFLLLLIDVVCSYLLAYKRSILYADQKNHYVNIIHIGYVIVMNLLQILTLILTHNFYLYLFIRIAMRIIENAVISLIVNKYYLFLNIGEVQSIDKETRSDIFIKMKALLAHKIGYFVVLGSDSIIISIFFGIKAVGLYSNYYIIIAAISTIFSQLFASITASVGNLLIGKDETKSYTAYARLRFANFWLSVIASIALIVVADSFITIWIGDKYILPLGVVLALGINLYLQLTRSVTNSFKDAAGIFHEDRFVPIAESLVNIISAVIFLQFFGLAGVFIGTICSNLVLHLFSYPKYVYTKIFKRSYKDYYVEFLQHSLIAIFSGLLTFVVSRAVTFDNRFVELMFNVSISIILPSIIIFLIYRNTNEFVYFKQLAIKISLRIKKDKLRKSN